ncbi:MAG TPA: hypothetical protein VK545_20940 [Streptomyces sp.]|nr:hypothetical protein [Streptomyces sp.]
MENLTIKHGVEFAVIYRLGPGPKGTGGQCFLYSGIHNRVEVPFRGDSILVYHSHPRGSVRPSDQDKALLGLFEAAGSSMRSSMIVPVGRDGLVTTFTKEGISEWSQLK